MTPIPLIYFWHNHSPLLIFPLEDSLEKTFYSVTDDTYIHKHVPHQLNTVFSIEKGSNPIYLVPEGTTIEYGFGTDHSLNSHHKMRTDSLVMLVSHEYRYRFIENQLLFCRDCKGTGQYHGRREQPRQTVRCTRCGGRGSNAFDWKKERTKARRQTKLRTITA